MRLTTEQLAELAEAGKQATDAAWRVGGQAWFEHNRFTELTIGQDLWHGNDPVFEVVDQFNFHDLPFIALARNRWDDLITDLRECRAENENLKEKLTRRTDAHDRDGKELLMLRAEVERLKAQTRWVKVSERVPEKDTKVLVADHCGYVREAVWNGDTWDHEQRNRFVQWTEMPAPHADGEK